MADLNIHRADNISNALPLMQVAAARKRRHHFWRAYGKNPSGDGLMFDLEGEWGAQKQACRDPEWLAAAFGMLRAIDGAHKKFETTSHKCLYIFDAHGSDFCKIGISAGPVERLAQVQTCCPFPLSLHACVFAPTWRAGDIEQAVLRNARASGISAGGEWLVARPDDVLSMVFAVAQIECIPICDAHTWFCNMRERTFRAAKNNSRLKLKAG